MNPQGCDYETINEDDEGLARKEAECDAVRVGVAVGSIFNKCFNQNQYKIANIS